MRRWTRLVSLVALLLTMPLSLFGYGQTPQIGGSMIFVSPSEADILDPQRTTSTITYEFLQQLFDTLVVLENDLITISPHIATSWDVSEDGLTYTFRLRSDVLFHSGRPMTAEDWVWTFERLVDKGFASPNAWRIGNVSTIKAVDASTLVIQLNEPHSELMLNLTLPFLGVIDREAVELLGDQFGIDGVGGTGPFKFGSWIPGVELVLERNQEYKWGAPIYENPGPAYIERIVRRQIPELTTSLFELELGNVDVAFDIPPVEVERLRNVRGITMLEVAPRPSVMFFAFKTTRPLMQDINIRRALALAINQEEVVESVWLGLAEVPTGLVPTSVEGYSPAAEPSWAFNDPVRARQILDEAGWVPGPDGVRVKDGQRLEIDFLFYNAPLYQEVALLFQQRWRDIGVATNVSLPELAAFWGISRTDVYDVFGLGYGPLSMLDILGTYFNSANIPSPNRMAWNDARTDELLQIATTAVTLEAKLAALAELQEIVAEAAIFIPMSFPREFLGVSDRVQDLHPNGEYSTSLPQLLDVWLRQ